MREDWLQLDVIKLLGLDKELTAGEVDDISSKLSDEVWFRVFNEEIKNYLSKDEIDDFEALTIKTEGVDELMQIALKSFPKFNFEKAYVDVVKEVKKDFIRSYLIDLKEEEKDSQKKKDIDTIVEFLAKDDIDIKKLQLLTSNVIVSD